MSSETVELEAGDSIEIGPKCGNRHSAELSHIFKRLLIHHHLPILTRRPIRLESMSYSKATEYYYSVY